LNQLPARIVGILSEGAISLVDADVAGDTLTSIMVETPQSAPYLQIGAEVLLLFKETELSLAKNLSGLLSLRNRLRARVRSIRPGTLLAEVELDYRGYTLVSIITRRAVERLELSPGDEVEALIKANEVILGARP